MEADSIQKKYEEFERGIVASVVVPATCLGYLRMAFFEGYKTGHTNGLADATRKVSPETVQPPKSGASLLD